MSTVANSTENSGWYVEHLTSTLLVSDSGIQLVESWSVVAKQALDEVLIEVNLDGIPAFTAPTRYEASRGGLEAIGAEIRNDRWPPSASGRPVVSLLFPSVLVAPVDRHYFEIHARSRGARRPRHVVVPPAPCRVMDLRVHFSQTMAPARVRSWRAGAASVPAQAPSPGSAVSADVPVDPAGDVHLRFTDVHPGSAQGVCWG